jgi:hypothetical protein
MIDIAGKIASLLSNKVRTAVATIDLNRAAGLGFDELEVYS